MAIQNRLPPNRLMPAEVSLLLHQLATLPKRFHCMSYGLPDPQPLLGRNRPIGGHQHEHVVDGEQLLERLRGCKYQLACDLDVFRDQLRGFR